MKSVGKGSLKSRLSSRGNRPLTIGLLLIAIGLIDLAPSWAAHKVVFHDMRTLIVDTIEPNGEMYRLILDSGAQMIIPQFSVREIRLIEPPAVVAEIETGDDDWRVRAGDFEEFVSAAAEEFDLDPELITAVALVESRFDQFAKSPKGALGIMQIMPATATELGLDNPYDAETNIAAGARYLRRMLDRFNGNLDLALAAYNAGPHRVQQYGGVPPFNETRRYLIKIQDLLRAMRSGSTDV